jgi:hypothetical protein
VVNWRAGVAPAAIAVVVPVVAGTAWAAARGPQQSASGALVAAGYPNLVATHCEKIGLHDWNCLVASRKTGLLAAVRFRDHLAGDTQTFSIAERRVGQLPGP